MGTVGLQETRLEPLSPRLYFLPSQRGLFISYLSSTLPLSFFYSNPSLPSSTCFSFSRPPLSPPFISASPPPALSSSAPSSSAPAGYSPDLGFHFPPSIVPLILPSFAVASSPTCFFRPAAFHRAVLRPLHPFLPTWLFASACYLWDFFQTTPVATRPHMAFFRRGVVHNGGQKKKKNQVDRR